MKLYFSLWCTLFFFFSSLEASLSEGKKIYTQECLKCHLNLKAVAGKKSSTEWKRLLEVQGETNALARLHLDHQEANASWDYFKGDAYQEDIKDLQDVLIKYSADHSKHTSCH